MKRFALSFLSLICWAVSSNATVSGTVVDASGTPVPDAMVTYTNLANRLIYAYTNSAGQFCIPAPTAWSLNNLTMYSSCLCVGPSCGSQAKPIPFKTKPVSSFNIRTQGSTVFFSVGTPQRAITADIYDSRGKLVMRAFNRTLGEGTYCLTLAAGLSRQMYCVRLSDGMHAETFRMLNCGGRVSAPDLDKITLTKSSDPVSLAKITAVDGLRAGKTGYAPDTIQLNSYDQAVGNVPIRKIDIEYRIDSLLSLMTQDEKIGQLMQPSGGLGDEAHARTYLLGSMLKGEGSNGPMNGALQTRLKIPLIVGNDWVHGGRRIYFPHEIGLGCTGDTLLVELAYRIYAMCCLPLYNNECFAPCIDVHRNDCSGRVYEGFAETPELTVPLTRAAIRGLQGTDLSSGTTMMATLKHWAAGGGTAGGGGGTDANTAPNLGVLAQIHFTPFYAGVKAGAAAVMTGYQKVFGTVMSINKQLVTDTLKTGWGFDGFVISDWGTSGNQEAACVNAGHDLCMTVDPATFPGKIKAAVPGTIPQARLDDAVKRILRTKFRMGLFENPWPNLNLNNYLASQEYRDVARQCVRKSLVLLKNDNTTLPLAKTATIHVVGAWADNIGYQCGGWSATGATLVGNTNALASGDEGWQGTGNAHQIGGATTILQGIQAACAGKGTVSYNAAATNIPAAASVIVVAIGETPYAEYNGDRTDISLPADQQTLVQTCAASGKPVVTILITGRPNVLGTIPTNSKAIIAAWLPGTEGEGVSDVLFGDYNPTGKLCVTWPAANNQEPINTGSMGDVVGAGGAPLFAYGFGLSYP
jgi:beta-glucosidase